MLIGAARVGKTSLANYINDYKGALKRTADVIYGENTIDVPSSYIENTSMYKHIIALAQDAKKIVFLIDATNNINIYSDGFAKLFTCPVIGVITKGNYQSESYEKCEKQLERAGVKRPYFIINNESLSEKEKLKEYLLK